MNTGERRKSTPAHVQASEKFVCPGHWQHHPEVRPGDLSPVEAIQTCWWSRMALPAPHPPPRGFFPVFPTGESVSWALPLSLSQGLVRTTAWGLSDVCLSFPVEVEESSFIFLFGKNWVKLHGQLSVWARNIYFLHYCLLTVILHVLL